MLKISKLNYLNLSLVFLFAIIFLACKKGENDPFLSLKTRNARIVGTWALEYSNSTRKQTITNLDTTIVSETTSFYENGTEISIGSEPDTVKYSLTFVLKKDGTMSYIQNYDEEYIEDSGIWYWSNDTKNKSGIVIYGNDNVVDRLTDKELVLKSSRDAYYVYDDGTKYKYDFESTIKFSKKN